MPLSTYDQIPPTGGTYALLLWLPHPTLITVGSLGMVDFPSGSFVYVGSACGPGGLRARITRHLAGNGRPHWHIDHLRRHASVVGVCYSTGKDVYECQWSQALADITDTRICKPSFGSSDCNHGCTSHLIHFIAPLSLSQLRQHLSKRMSG